MKNDELIRIAVAETSVILRGGLAGALRRLPDLRIQPIELTSHEALRDYLRTQTPPMLIVNPTFDGHFDIDRFRTEQADKNIRIVAFVCTLIPPPVLSKYDETLTIYDDPGLIAAKISRMQNIKPASETDQPETLSQREKEVVICAVKGMTNKETAEKLFLSIHTVITHRRNITKKLQINSTAGLAIYAIVNKLIELSDVKEGGNGGTLTDH